MILAISVFSRSTISGGVPLGRHDAEPDRGLVARHGLAHRRHVGQHGRAPLAPWCRARRTWPASMLPFIAVTASKHDLHMAAHHVVCGASPLFFVRHVEDIGAGHGLETAHPPGDRACPARPRHRRACRARPLASAMSSGSVLAFTEGETTITKSDELTGATATRVAHQHIRLVGEQRSRWWSACWTS